MVAGSTTPIIPPVVLKEHRLTQSDIDLIIDVEAPSYGLSPKLVKKISRCEDGGNPYVVHHNSDAVLSTDHGPLQVNDYWHSEEVAKRKIDLDEPVQSLRYGMEIMKREGTTPWNWSKGCWGK